MEEIFGWMFLVFGAHSSLNAYLHSSRSIRPSYWLGATAAGQACLAAGCIAMAAMALPFREPASPLLWAIGSVGVATFWLGLRIESRAWQDVRRPASA